MGACQFLAPLVTVNQKVVGLLNFNLLTSAQRCFPSSFNLYACDSI
jgi:hypothetical protein